MIKNKLSYPKVVVALIWDQNSRLLVSQRSLNSSVAPGKWQIPGGKVEKNESHSEALKREIKEETDLDTKLINKLVFRYLDTENKFEVYFYEVKTEGTVKVQEPSKLNSEWIYLSLSELKNKELVPSLTKFVKELN